MSTNLLIRVDASQAIGSGHVMRCIALGQAWQENGGEVMFACAEMPPDLMLRIIAEGFRFVQIETSRGTIEDAERTAQAASSWACSWIATDGYQFDPSYLAALQRSHINLLCVDDTSHQPSYPANILLNPNLSGSEQMYAQKLQDDTAILLGPRHALVRREFQRPSGAVRPPPREPLRVLVTFGGSDPENYTSRVISGLIPKVPSEITVIAMVGASNSHTPELQEIARTRSFPCEVITNVQNVASLMEWADVAVSAAGTTVWELLSMRLPALVGGVADNQIIGLRALESISMFKVALAEDLITTDLLTAAKHLLKTYDKGAIEAILLARGLDGKGAPRVVKAMNDYPVSNR